MTESPKTTFSQDVEKISIILTALDKTLADFNGKLTRNITVSPVMQQGRLEVAVTFQIESDSHGLVSREEFEARQAAGEKS
jgi:hypothetical protein